MTRTALARIIPLLGIWTATASAEMPSSRKVAYGDAFRVGSAVNLLFAWLCSVAAAADTNGTRNMSDPRGKMKPRDKGAWETGEYRNVFLEAGYSQQDIDAKLAKAYSDVFEGPHRVYFEIGNLMAYVSDLKNEDVHAAPGGSEGCLLCMVG